MTIIITKYIILVILEVKFKNCGEIMVDYLTKDEILRARELLTLRKNGDRDLLLFNLAVNSGLRISDILPITLADLKKGSLKMQKTKKIIKLYIPMEIIKEVQEYTLKCGIKETDLIFTTFRKKDGSKRASVHQMTYINALKIMKSIGDDLGLNLGCHSTRKTFGRSIYDSCKDIALAAVSLGHTNTASTLRYIGLTNDRLEAERLKVGVI